MTVGAGKRLVDRLAEHEMGADQPHRLADGGAQGGQPDTPDDGIKDRLRRLARMDDARRNPKRPGRSRNQQRRGLDVAVEPAAGGELVLNEPVGGRRIGHAQQRLGEHHQGQALFGRERIGVEKILDAAEPSSPGADRLDERACARIDAALGGGVAFGTEKEISGQILVGRRVRRAEGGSTGDDRCHGVICRGNCILIVSINQPTGRRCPRLVGLLIQQIFIA
jgi:hypothetical protein